MLNRHVLADRAYLGTWRFRFGEAFAEGAVSPSFQEHVAALQFEMPPLAEGGLHEFSIESQAGPMLAAYEVLCWADPRAPTVIWHHRQGETAFARSARAIFDTRTPMEANVVGVRAPFHRSRAEYRSGLAYLSRFVAMMAAAVEITERLVRCPALADSARVMVAGYGLGGFVTNRHHLHYNSAGGYVPFMAGTAQGELWLSTLPVAAIAGQRPDALRQALNFQNEWKAMEHDNVHAVLGRFDQVCRWDVQRPSYGERRVAAWETGHVTGWRSQSRIRQKVERHLFEAQAARSPAESSSSTRP